jgi:myosin-9
MVKIRCGSLHPVLESVEVALVESQRADEVVRLVLEKLQIGRPADFVLAEALLVDGQVCKERRLEAGEKPAKLQAMWPQTPSGSSVNMATYDFFIRRKDDLQSSAWVDSVQVSRASAIVNTLVKQKQQDCADLCNLPDLNEKTMLAALKKRFQDGQIYTYVNSILIAMNPFRFLPIYNPKHMKMYERCKLSDLPPHIFAIADGAYQSMLQQKVDQCIVISGESGSGKTESTNLVLHQLLHLSQKGYGEGGIEQVIAASGPVLQVCLTTIGAYFENLGKVCNSAY